MEYMFLIYADEAKASACTPEENQIKRERTCSVLDDAMNQGVLRGANPLSESSGARTFRCSEGGVRATDGPYAETREVLGGYWIIDCKDAGEASGWASRLTQTGCADAVEVRAIRPVPARVAGVEEPVTSFAHA